MQTSYLTGKLNNIFIWTLQILAGALFVMAGFGKLSGTGSSIELFDTIGIGQWFRFLSGSLELFGGLGLFVPSLAGAGASILAIVMVGAVFLHLFVIGGSPLMAVILLTVTLTIAWKRRGDLTKHSQ